MKFESFKVDLVTDVTQEFMCPFGHSSEEDEENFVHLKGAHMFTVPMMTICCGNSACFECFKYVFALQLNQSDTIYCPFCGKQPDENKKVESFLVHNKWLNQFLENELLKDERQLTQVELENLGKEFAKSNLRHLISTLKESKELQLAYNKDARAAEAERQKTIHPLIKVIEKETLFFLLKMPN